MAKVSNLTLENVTMDQLNGKYVEFERLSGSGDVYEGILDQGYNHVFKIENNSAYDYTMDDKGNLVQDTKPVVSLTNITVQDDSGTGTKTVPGILYIAERDVQDPYELNEEVQQSPIIGEPAVAFVQALSLYIQSLQFFSYDSYLGTEIRILDHVFDEDDTDSTSTTTTSTSTTTSTTTVAPSTTSTTTTK